MTDTETNYLRAITSVSALARDNARLEREVNQLIAGTAKQAKTIRTLNEEVSKRDAEVKVEQYNVEFFKNQGRKTRRIRNEKMKALKARITELEKEVSDTIPRLRADAERFRHMLSQSEADRVLASERANGLSRENGFLRKQNENLRLTATINVA